MESHEPRAGRADGPALWVPFDLALRLTGGGLLVAAASLHLDLYLTGYRFVPTIGPLFLVQVVAAYVLGLGVVVLARPWLALAGAGFSLATLGGYVLSRTTGLFGFHEVRTEAGIVAGVLEVAAFCLLGIWVLRAVPSSLVQALGRAAIPAGIVGALVALAAVGVSPSGRSTPRPRVGGAASSATVLIQNFAFRPDHLTVRPGAPIRIVNVDGVGHTFTAMPNSVPFGAFDSGTIQPGEAKIVSAPDAAGRYAFICAIHPFMTGVLTVRS